MNKKEYQERRNNEDKTLINFHPELNQSGIYDNEGNKLPKPKREQYDPIPRGFIDSGLLLKLTARDIYIYFFLSSKCNKWRNTWVTNDYITRETGIPDITIKRALKKLKFYNFISSRKYFTKSNISRSRRVITLLRWDTAYKKLVIEGKIKANSGEDKNPIITPYLPGKVRKKYQE
jgi:hypothetical protein